MNYPIWDLPSAGLLIAAVAILHVFVSHFAVGGGLFLVLTERKARREGDDGLLDYVRRHSRFFVLLTLVFGAVTGVGIWFTIGLVHPTATAALITTFVWGWAIEWTFFATEIAAALVYYYGWDRLTPRQHMTVGWIYFGTAWASLVVINGILTYMMTPGSWIEGRGFWEGFFNPTYWPALAIRTLGAVGLAGVYALFTSMWLASPELRRKLWRWATLGWVLPMAVGLPLALLWFFPAAERGGVPVAAMFGARSSSVADLLASLAAPAPSGHPIAQLALRVAIGAVTATFALTLLMVVIRKDRFARIGAGVLMVAALLSVGGAEWVREDLRKPFVIGAHMFVNGVRIPPPDGSAAAKLDADDPYRIDRIQESGLLPVARYARWRPEPGAVMTAEQEMTAGGEMFRLLCSQCHTTDGYLALRPLVAGRSSATLEGMLDRLAVPLDARGHVSSWSDPDVRLASWRNRAMPPFAGTPAERRALAVWLARLGGGPVDAPAADPGAALFDAQCGVCHGPDGDFPILDRLAGMGADELDGMIARLPEINDVMPPFEGTPDERRVLAEHLAALASSGGAR